MTLINDKIKGPGMHDHPREVIRCASVAAFPVTGKTNAVYLASDSKKLYEFDGAVYNLLGDIYSLKMKVVSATSGATAAITGGTLYNHYAVTDVRNIAPAGWHVSTDAEWTALQTYLGGYLIAGGKLKSTAADAWTAPNTEAANLVGFGARGAGYRNVAGQFYSAGNFGFFHTPQTAYGATCSVYYILMNNDAQMQRGNGNPRNMGYSIRYVKDATGLVHGQTSTMSLNDGTIIPTICINGVEWSAVNSVDTKYLDGSAITEVTDGAAWGALLTGGRCNYNNDAAYVQNTTGESSNTVGNNDFLKFIEGPGVVLTITGNTLTIASKPMASVEIAVNTNAVKNKMYVLTASCTLTLPAAPAIDDYLGVTNQSGTITPIIARNGLKIMGLAEDLTINKLNIGFKLMYTGINKGWIIY